MPVILPNTYIWTARSVYNPVTGATSAPVAYLSMLSAHLEPIPATQYVTLPADVLDCTYYGTVDEGTDLVANDVLTMITELDGITPWPYGSNANVTYIVRKPQPLAAALLPSLSFYLAEVTAGGPAE